MTVLGHLGARRSAWARSRPAVVRRDDCMPKARRHDTRAASWTLQDMTRPCTPEGPAGSVDMHGNRPGVRRRRLVLTPELMARFRQHRVWQAETQMAAGPLWQDHGRIMRGRSRRCDIFTSSGPLDARRRLGPDASGRGSGIRRGQQAAGHRCGGALSLGCSRPPWLFAAGAVRPGAPKVRP